MRTFILILSFLFISYNQAYDMPSKKSVQSLETIRKLKLIKDSYEWAKWPKTKREMIRKQNMLVYNEELKELYKEYLIKVETPITM